MALLKVKVKEGWLQGMPAANQMFSVFRGVPFAEPPVGNLRWKDPQPKKPWDGIRNCYIFPAIAMQERLPSEGGNRLAAREFYVGDLQCSEDCLYLNIWTPAKSREEKLPVAIYIHGGGHQTGYSYLNCYDGEGFCKRGIIMVTIPYRLNVFGYLCHPELTAEGGTPGNYGVKDQLAAIRWVKENIAAFGGDPENITLFGQSGGASSVDNLCVLPLARGLFQRAIMQSGGGIRPVYSFWSSSVERAEEAGAAFLKELGVSSIKEARACDSESILAAYSRLQRKKLREEEPEPMVPSMGYVRFSPLDDGKIFPKQVTEYYRSGDYPQLDYMLGSTNGEHWETTIQNLAFAERNAELGYKPCYLYYFTYVPPGADRAHHSVEHHYVFQTLNRSYRPYAGKDWDLSNELADYWANFMRTGNPNTPGQDLWKPYNLSQYNALEIGENRSMIHLSERKEIQANKIIEKAEALKNGETDRK